MPSVRDRTLQSLSQLPNHVKGCALMPLIGRGLTFGSADDNALEPVDDSASGQSNQG
jgi:hypothetical protein